MECSEREHEHTSGSDEYGLTEACIHGSDMDIPTVVDLLGEEYDEGEEARTREKHPESHERKGNSRLRNGVHIKEEQSDRRATREKDE